MTYFISEDWLHVPVYVCICVSEYSSVCECMCACICAGLCVYHRCFWWESEIQQP